MHFLFSLAQSRRSHKCLHPSTPPPPPYQAHGAEEFRAKVMDKAIPWSDWYGDSILADHDFAGDANAFRRCTDRLTGFMSDLSIPTDQTFHVHRFAKALAGGESFHLVSLLSLSFVVLFALVVECSPTDSLEFVDCGVLSVVAQLQQVFAH